LIPAKVSAPSAMSMRARAIGNVISEVYIRIAILSMSGSPGAYGWRPSPAAGEVPPGDVATRECMVWLLRTKEGQVWMKRRRGMVELVRKPSPIRGALHRLTM
jgi:hypothetical protein